MRVNKNKKVRPAVFAAKEFISPFVCRQNMVE
jgi:hypothetical protein